jgi:hypothetical protein
LWKSLTEVQSRGFGLLPGVTVDENVNINCKYRNPQMVHAAAGYSGIAAPSCSALGLYS